MDDDPDTTADQDQWMDLARAVRAGLMKQAALLSAMTPEEIKAFIEACRDALFLEVNASSFDKRVELEQNRVTAD